MHSTDEFFTNPRANGLEVFRFFCRLCGGCPPAEDSALEGQNMSEGMGL